MTLIKRIVPTKLVCSACVSLAIGARCPARCERNFVLGGWSASFKHSSEAGIITAVDWAAVMHVQIAKICARPETRVLVAHGTVADSLLGFIAGEPDEKVVYYCFVKEAYRQNGIATALFKALGVDPKSRFAYPASTQILTRPDGPRLKRKIPLAIVDSSVARYPKTERHRSYQK